jgi:hypothetical protein
MMVKKGQAAMEFLMTYGWAILAAVIVIGVLASFGVFSPSKYVPTACTLSAPLGCDESAASTTAVSLVIRNGLGESIDVSTVAISGCGADSTGYILADQGTQLVAVTCDSALTSGEKFNGNIVVTYTKSAGGILNQTSSGSVIVPVV